MGSINGRIKGSIIGTNKGSINGPIKEGSINGPIKEGSINGHLGAPYCKTNNLKCTFNLSVHFDFSDPWFHTPKLHPWGK